MAKKQGEQEGRPPLVEVAREDYALSYGAGLAAGKAAEEQAQEATEEANEVGQEAPQQHDEAPEGGGN